MVPFVEAANTPIGWPDDWPEDAKVGSAFLRELMKRFPKQVQIGTFEEAAREEKMWNDFETRKDGHKRGF